MLNNPPFPAAKVGYHGRIYIDQATHGVMSLSIITDDAPKHFPIRKAAVRVDYDYVAINDHDYLLPVSAQVITKLPGESITGKLVKRNDIAFSNFRKFGSTARIVGAASPERGALALGKCEVHFLRLFPRRQRRRFGHGPADHMQ